MSGKFDVSAWELQIPNLNDEFIIQDEFISKFDLSFGSRQTNPNFDRTNDWKLIDPLQTRVRQWVVERSTPNNVKIRFDRLERKWLEESSHLSSINDISTLWPYQEIMAMGPVVVPHILASLAEKPNHWFWALSAITGADPIPKSARGNIPAMRAAWLGWAESQGLVG